jgi:tRNA(adenine34) deaminase
MFAITLRRLPRIHDQENNFVKDRGSANASRRTYMREALRIACEQESDPSLSPIGCVVVLRGDILSGRRNRVAGHHDATAHAEIEAIRAAGASFENGELRDATLYATLQPCGMCTMASIWSKVSRIVYGAE